MSEREMEIKIARMGYTPFVVKKEKPNFYKLEDGTILKIHPMLNAIMLNDKQHPETASLNIHNVASTFVPQSLRGKRTTEKMSLEEAISTENIDKADLKFEVLSEHFNEYVVDRKWLFSLKTTLTQVNRSKIKNNIGEPIYSVNTAPIPKFKPKGR